MLRLLKLEIPDKGEPLQNLIDDCSLTLKHQVKTGKKFVFIDGLLKNRFGIWTSSRACKVFKSLKSKAYSRGLYSFTKLIIYYNMTIYIKYNISTYDIKYIIFNPTWIYGFMKKHMFPQCVIYGFKLYRGMWGAMVLMTKTPLILVFREQVVLYTSNCDRCTWQLSTHERAIDFQQISLNIYTGVCIVLDKIVWLSIVLEHLTMTHLKVPI